MSNSPHLTDNEVLQVRELLDEVRRRLDAIANGDGEKLHHVRRHLWKRIEFDERGTPASRKKLRLALLDKQKYICAICKDPSNPLPIRDSELDRIQASKGYTIDNTVLVHHACHRKSQAGKNFS